MNIFMPKQLTVHMKEKFHERYKVSKLIQQEIHNINSLILKEQKIVCV